MYKNHKLSISTIIYKSVITSHIQQSHNIDSPSTIRRRTDISSLFLCSHIAEPQHSVVQYFRPWRHHLVVCPSQSRDTVSRSTVCVTLVVICRSRGQRSRSWGNQSLDSQCATKDLRTLVYLLTGHNTLNRHLTIMRRVNDPLWWW